MSYQLSELQEKWLQALESGEYRQTTGVLRDREGGHCCLGVACRVVGLNGGLDVGDAAYVFEGGYSESAPGSVVAALRLRGEVGEAKEAFSVEIDGETVLTTYLADANDKGATFAEIAAAIRANPENFFK